MVTFKTGQHYCNDRCTTMNKGLSKDKQIFNCYSFNRSKTYLGIWTNQPSNYFDKLYIPPRDNREALHRNKTLAKCKNYLTSGFEPFSHGNIVSVTWRGYSNKSNTGDCYTYTQVGDSCTTPVNTIDVSIKPKDRNEMAPAVTNFAQHVLQDYFR